MKFTDILSLAKQGYTPQDIKDLLALSTDQDADKEAEPKDPEIPPDHVDAEPAPEPEKDEHAEDLDYKKLYEEEQQKTAKLQKLVLSADLSDKDPKESDIDMFADAMKSFM